MGGIIGLTGMALPITKFLGLLVGVLTGNVGSGEEVDDTGNDDGVECLHFSFYDVTEPSFRGSSLGHLRTVSNQGTRRVTWG